MKLSRAALAAATATATAMLQATRKRRVAFTLAYLGDHFYGNQHQGPDLRTCEQQLERAIYRAGMLKPSNYGSPAKSGFNRASRTDKGVHAMSAVASLKIEVPGDDAFDESTGRLDPLATDKIRRELPDDMDLLTATRVGKKFSARQAANYRRYRYYLPKHIFKRSLEQGSSCEEVRESLHRNLSLFNGNNFFHNFSREVRKHGEHALPQRRTISSHEDEAGANEIRVKRGGSSLRRSILHCGVEGEDERYFYVQVAGQSFIYNQIRAIIGASAAVTGGLMPGPQAITNALSELAPLYRTGAPLVPAAPLVLTDTSFTPQSMVLMRASDAREVYGEACVPRYNKKKSVRVLMDGAADSRAKRFMDEVILKSIWDKCCEYESLEEFLGIEDGGASLTNSEWGAESRLYRQSAFNTEHGTTLNEIRLPNGLATAAASRFGLRPGCLIKDAINSLKDKGRCSELGDTLMPDIETCLKALEPLLGKSQQEA